jgi:hypothetical protein
MHIVYQLRVYCILLYFLQVSTIKTGADDNLSILVTGIHFIITILNNHVILFISCILVQELLDLLDLIL